MLPEVAAAAEPALSFRPAPEPSRYDRQPPLKSPRWNDNVTDKVTDELPVALNVLSQDRESALSVSRPLVSAPHTHHSLTHTHTHTHTRTHTHTHTKSAVSEITSHLKTRFAAFTNTTQEKKKKKKD